MGEHDSNDNSGQTTPGGVGGLDAVGAQPVPATPVQPVTTDPDQVQQPETVDVPTSDKPDATSDAAPDAAPVDNVGETEPTAAPRQQSDMRPNL